MLNTSSFNAPFVDPGLSLSDCCEPFGVGDRLRIQGKVVAIGFGSFAEGCEIETSYLNLVDGGAFGIVLLPEASVAFTPGYYSNGHAWLLKTTIEAARPDVPMVEVSKPDAGLLRKILRESSDPIYMVLEPDENPWRQMHNQWVWVLLMRVLTPVGYFSVLLTGIAAMSGGYHLGTTKACPLSLAFALAGCRACFPPLKHK